MVGCGAAQELLPFVASVSALGVGVDLSPAVGAAARALQFHHARYYLNRLVASMSALDAPGTIHGLRVLLTGVYYQISGRQPSTRLTAGGEVFQTERYSQAPPGASGTARLSHDARLESSDAVLDHREGHG